MGRGIIRKSKRLTKALQVRRIASFHTMPLLDRDIKLIVSELSEHVKPFKGRHHKNIKIMIKSLNSSKFYSWMNEKWNSFLAGLISSTECKTLGVSQNPSQSLVRMRGCIVYNNCVAHLRFNRVCGNSD